MIAHVPIHALFHKKGAADQSLGTLQAWDCFGWNLSVVEFDYLKEARIQCKLGRDEFESRYVATIDFLDNGYSDEPTQHKMLHLLKLDNGNFALQPNNKCRMIEKSFTTKHFTWEDRGGIETNEMLYRCEDEL